MIALRLAIRVTPMARVIVIIAGNPSGIAATAIPTAAVNISFAGLLHKATPTKNVKVAIIIIAIVNQRLKVPIWRNNGVVIAFLLVSIELIRPISVL